VCVCAINLFLLGARSELIKLLLTSLSKQCCVDVSSGR